MDNMVMMLGYLLMGCGGLYLMGVNRCLWLLVESLGGIKHFNRYKAWLRENKDG